MLDAAVEGVRMESFSGELTTNLVVTAAAIVADLRLDLGLRRHWRQARRPIP